MMGGRDTVFEAASEAAAEGDYQWAAELTTHLVRLDNDDREARLLKAAALRQIGYSHTNNNWRNWYLTSAQELDGTIDYSKALDIQAPDMLRAFPTAEFIRGLRFRLKAEDTLNVNMTMGFSIPDEKLAYGIEIRRGVAQFYESLPDNAEVILEIDRETLNYILARDMESLGIDGVQAGSLPAALLQSGKAKLTRGTAEDFQRFFGYFDPVSHEPIPMTIR